jgi:hypothetical protein
MASVDGFGTVRVRDIATGQVLAVLKGHGSGDTDKAQSPDSARLAYSPDGTRLASAGVDRTLDGTVMILDAVTGQEVASLKGHTSAVNDIAYSPDSARLATAGQDGTVQVWDLAIGQQVAVLKGHNGPVRCVAFSPDGGRLASGGDDGAVRVWDARPLTEEVRDERDALSRLAFLFERPLLKEEVRESLTTDKTISEPVRALALKFLDRYADDPRRLHEPSWAVVRRPGADAAKYRRAVQLAEAARRLEPENGNYLTTLGVARYRAGQYPAALEALTRARTINAQRLKGDHPADVAFLALCQQQLGQPEQAGKLLAELRELMKKPQWANDEEAQAFLREAEALFVVGPPRP